MKRLIVGGLSTHKGPVLAIFSCLAALTLMGIFGSHDGDKATSAEPTDVGVTAVWGPSPDEVTPTPTSTVPVAPATTYASGSECDADITPEKDGICRVSDGGFFSTGLMAGWIETQARPGERCMWARLDGPKMELQMVIDAGGASEGDLPVDVQIEKGDYAFYSTGCQPWKRIG